MSHMRTPLARRMPFCPGRPGGFGAPQHSEEFKSNIQQAWLYDAFLFRHMRRLVEL